jgi:hypothetical protein
MTEMLTGWVRHATRLIAESPVAPLTIVQPLVSILASLLLLGFNVVVNFLHRVLADFFLRSLVGSFVVVLLGRIHDD